MTPSCYQLDFFRQVAGAVTLRRVCEPFRHVVVQASAGSGKTSTIVEYCKRYPQHSAVVVAFGTKNAAELKQRLPSNASASTLHSFGSRAWTEMLGGRRYAPSLATYGHSGGEKIDRIMRPEVEAGRIPGYWRGKVAKLVNLARMHGIVPGSRVEAAAAFTEYPSSPGTAAHTTAHPTQLSIGDALVNDVLPLRGLVADTDAEWERLMHHFDISVGTASPAPLIRMARAVLRTSIRYGHKIIDFADMLYLPTLAVQESGASPWRVDAEVVFVDELQDLDGLQREMVLGLVRSGCVFVGVGDPQQAIYSWRGADCESMAKIIRATDAVVMPLPICYRCPTSHLDMARQYSPGIEAREGAPLGLLERYDDNGLLACNAPHEHGLACECAIDRDGTREILAATLFSPGDVVLCRSKAPLVRAAYWLLKHRRPARILGKDLAKGLLTFVDAMRADSVVGLIKAAERYTDRAVARASELEDDQAMEEALDRIEVIRAVADSYEGDDVEGFKAELQGLFGDGEDRDSVVTLSSLHRFKGHQAVRIWWLDYLKPDPNNVNFKHDWQRKEAVCLRNVACTRSTSELRLILSESLT